jgi:signal transduction histidine kinase
VDRPDRGAGLRIMHYRARLIGAALDLQSRPGAGTTVGVRLNRNGETPFRSLEGQLREIAFEAQRTLPPGGHR